MKTIFEYFSETVEVLVPLVFEKIIMNVTLKKNLKTNYQLIDIILQKYDVIKIINNLCLSIQESQNSDHFVYVSCSLELLNMILKKMTNSDLDSGQKIIKESNLIDFLFNIINNNAEKT
mmetsp:Transcript_17276/g.16484  ORF Transcript_17276/g.16484 Transcript_17276/m.16484 type:complete len:119 (+) Transcript_17276:1700-2056(+)|eukprot:CAMPEP_0170542208 /NCGR_PEP_ID=MMETSP0211-20121228/1707_1 /TAXON_ID=311385 /ORGANISM="Pseudokeronopsis sp., Strain OXSARD2" /LENGTH=118 /DNA_ID=CAMNT_0010845195 /DNA_START=1700 /DNA_END=2056 /DNA_ORIENTATION=+